MREAMMPTFETPTSAPVTVYAPESGVVFEPQMLGGKDNNKKEPGGNFGNKKRDKAKSFPDTRPKHTKIYPTSYPKDVKPKL